MKPKFVLDAWAILALLQREEPAATSVKQLIEKAQAGHIVLMISMINLGEVYYRVGKVRGRIEAQETLVDIERLSLTILPASKEAILAAADLKMQYAISYADAFAAATAEGQGAVLVTGDPDLMQLGDRIQLERLERQLK
jgi:predicted nucleic acid-binding protein